MGSRFFSGALRQTQPQVLCEETLHRVPAACTGPVFELPAVIAGRHLGGQECGEVVLPEVASILPVSKKRWICRAVYFMRVLLVEGDL